MSERRPDEPLSLVGELRRRRVLYTAVVYGISAFAVTEIAAFLFENFGAPAWAERLLAALFVAGFPVAVYLSWAFDIGADGIVRASPGDRRNRWSTIALATALLLVATGGLFYLIFPKPQAPTVSGAPDAEANAKDADYAFEPAEKLDNSIAVLPFESLSADPDDVFFSSGVAEEILNHLGTYREINIIGRTSSFAFKGSDLPAHRISGLLGVRYLLQGSVRRHHDQVRVSTQLLDDNGVQVWSRSFDRRLTDIFAIQTEIAISVAEAVVPRVKPPSLSAATVTLDAYDLYLKGRELVYQRSIPAAIEALERSIQLDPSYAPAHAELAVALAWGRNADVEAAARAVDTALNLNPELLRAMAAQGLILTQRRPPDLGSAEATLRQVLNQAPHMSDAVLWLGNTLWMQGRVAEAQELVERGVRTDPLHPVLVRRAMITLAERGEDRRAESIARRSIESPENRSHTTYYALFMFYRSRGQLEDAVRLARTWTETIESTEYTACYCMMIWAHSSLGDWSAADDWISRSERDFGATRHLHRYKVFTLRARGRYEEALAAMNRYLANHVPQGGQAPRPDLLLLGILEGLSGDHQAAVTTLAPLGDQSEMSLSSIYGALVGGDAMQALAWSYAQTGQADRSTAMLAQLEREFASLDAQGTLFFMLSDVPYHYALNALLQGQQETALDRLESIYESGWRTYYEHHLDPRWDPLRDHPRFQALMAKVKADVDRQREELESAESDEAFVARLDAGITATDESTK
jgi:TolB-like protein/Tfp pilus assembly protein PilF